MTEGLLPCRECGKEGAQLYNSEVGYFIKCPHCGFVSECFKSSSVLWLVNSWNEDYMKSKYRRTTDE